MTHNNSFHLATYPWNPDAGDGTYRNPIIHADYSDPDVIRVGDDFYMVASSFNCTPGLPILHSRDLVNWSLINHAIENVPHPRYVQVQPGCGVWAPAIRFHDGRYWIFFPDARRRHLCDVRRTSGGPMERAVVFAGGQGLD